MIDHHHLEILLLRKSNGLNGAKCALGEVKLETMLASISHDLNTNSDVSDLGT